MEEVGGGGFSGDATEDDTAAVEEVREGEVMSVGRAEEKKSEDEQERGSSETVGSTRDEQGFS